MKLVPSVCLAMIVVLGAVAGKADGGGQRSERPRPGIVPQELTTLASRADHRPGWAPLARYAESARSPELKGLAYFALGYRESQAGDFPAALQHLGRAVGTHFSLADFATYYQADAAVQADEPDIALQALDGFRDRYPRSTLISDATRVLARSQIATGAYPQAVQLLTHSSEFRAQPWYQLLLGQAQQKAGNLKAATESFEELYYRFPDSADAVPAGRALAELQSQLGASFTPPTEDLREARAQALEAGDRFQDAIEAYEALIKEQPASAAAPEWRLGRDRCLYRMGRAADALADLSREGWPPGDVDARRSLLVVRCEERLNNAGGMETELDRMARLYPASASYSAALDSAAYYFVAQGDRERGSKFSAALAAGFPDSDAGAKAQWQVAWAAYLSGDSGAARSKIVAYIHDHPASPRVASALYWLGRLAEADASRAEARALYALLLSRFHNNYFSLRAEERLKSVDAGARAEEVAGASGAAATSGAAPPEAIPAEVATALTAARPRLDLEDLCPVREPAPEARPALTLAALGFDDLALRDLRARIAASNNSPAAASADDTRLTLARVARDGEEYDQAAYYARRVLPDYANYAFAELPGDFWSLLYPEAFWSLVRRFATLNHLDPYLVMAVIREESGFNPRAASGAQAHGLMQLLAPTAREVAREGAGRRRRPRVNLNDPASNLRAGCHYLSEMIREFDGSLEEALAAYNAGPIRVRQWLAVRAMPEPAAFVESIPFADTKAYVEAVLRDAVVYRQLMTGRPAFKVCRAAPSASRRP